MHRPPARALLLSGYWPPHEGGVERYTQAMAAELAARGWDVLVAFADSGAAEDPAAGVTLRPYPVSVLAGRLPVPHVWRGPFRALRRELRQRPFDLVIVMSHHYVGSVLLARAASAPHRLWLNHVSGHIPTGARGRRGLAGRLAHRYEHTLAALQRRWCTHTAGVSSAAAAWLTHLGAPTDRVLPNAVTAPRDETAVTPAAPEPPPLPTAPRIADGMLEVVLVGRIEPDKGFDAAVDIVRTLARSLPAGRDVRLTIAGGGSRAGALAALAEGDARIRVLGSIPHDAVLELLHASDVLLLPSRYPEGLPTVLLEAAVGGLPIVAFPAGGTGDLIEDGVTGRIVTDVPEAVAALHGLLDDPDGAARMAHALTLRVAERFTWPRVVDTLLAQLEEAPHAP